MSRAKVALWLFVLAPVWPLLFALALKDGRLRDGIHLFHRSHLDCIHDQGFKKPSTQRHHGTLLRTSRPTTPGIGHKTL